MVLERAVFPQMFERARNLIDGSLVAELSAVAAAIRLLASATALLPKAQGACPVACALAEGWNRKSCVHSLGRQY